jgi:DNA-binding CsgD family transcriptional regulator
MNQVLQTLETYQDMPCEYSALVVVDSEAQIKFRYWPGPAGNDAKEMLCEEDGARLRTWLEVLVRSIIDSADSKRYNSNVILRETGKTLRLVPLTGLDGTLFGLVMETDPHGSTIRRAAERFNLTRRQIEVLVLVLGGATAGDVAHALCISEYTAQGYVKSLLTKTNSRNRASMVAKVLNWKELAHGERSGERSIERAKRPAAPKLRFAAQAAL